MVRFWPTFTIMLLATLLVWAATAYAAYDRFQFFKPYVEEWNSVASELKVVNRSLNENATTNQYTSASLDIQNYGATDHTGQVTITFYDGANMIIATGNLANTGVVQAGITVSVTIPITWYSNYTIQDWARARCEVKQLS